VADHQGPRSENRDQTPAEVGDPPSQRVEKQPVEQDTRIRESLSPITVEDDHAGDEIFCSISPLVTPGGIALSDCEKAEILADNLEDQFQSVTDPSFPAVIKIVGVALRSYFLTPASEPKLNNPDGVHEAISCLKVSNARSTNGIPNRTLKHLPKRSVYLQAHNINAVLHTHTRRFPQTWKSLR